MMWGLQERAKETSRGPLSALIGGGGGEEAGYSSELTSDMIDDIKLGIVSHFALPLVSIGLALDN